jgi:hypothetical protein
VVRAAAAPLRLSARDGPAGSVAEKKAVRSGHRTRALIVAEKFFSTIGY